MDVNAVANVVLEDGSDSEEYAVMWLWVGYLARVGHCRYRNRQADQANSQIFFGCVALVRGEASNYSVQFLRRRAVNDDWVGARREKAERNKKKVHFIN